MIEVFFALNGLKMKTVVSATVFFLLVDFYVVPPFFNF
ncbi:hypothetical protein ABIB30_000241 [Pedobacter sp. UYP1]